MLRRLYNWTMSRARTRYAEPSLAGVAFVESSFFPIPPDVLLIPMILATPEKWVRYALICTIGSVAGSLLGYLIGMTLFESIGKYIIALYNAQNAFDHILEWYDTWGVWGILVGAVTPFPYKILTIFSGFSGFNVLTLLAVSIIGRGFRFFLVSWLLYRLGEPIRIFIEQHLGLLLTLFVVLLIGGFMAVRYIF